MGYNGLDVFVFIIVYLYIVFGNVLKLLLLYVYCDRGILKYFFKLEFFKYLYLNIEEFCRVFFLILYFIGMILIIIFFVLLMENNIWDIDIGLDDLIVIGSVFMMCFCMLRNLFGIVM